MNKKRIGLLFDSSCGFTKEKIEKDGHFFVPMSIRIDNEEYLSGINIDNDLLFKKMKEIPRPFQTSAVNINEFEKNLEKALEAYEQIIVISISKHISGTNEIMKHFVSKNEKYKNIVHVFDSELLTPWIQYFYPDLLMLVKQEKVEIENVFNFLKFYNDNQVGYVSPNNLERLKIGGRLSKAQYQIAKLLKINPILEIVRGDIENAKVIKVKNKSKIVPKMISILEESYEKMTKEKPDAIIQYLYLHHENEEMKEQMNKLAEKKGILISGEVILSPEINAHVGEKAFGLGILEYRSWDKFI